MAIDLSAFDSVSDLAYKKRKERRIGLKEMAQTGAGFDHKSFSDGFRIRKWFLAFEKMLL